ncbi:MAG: hypothetical protein V8T36_06890 [Ruthenibacterium lactatiformans]
MAVGFPKEELLSYGVSENDLILTEAPSAEELARLDPFYMSYFLPWNSYKNYQIAKEHGFHDLTHEWDRTHHAENFDQIDSRAYLVHSWLKYPKFGHAAATDYTARYIRYGMMTREEAIPIIKSGTARWTRCACGTSARSAATPRPSSGPSWTSSTTGTSSTRTSTAAGC